MPHITFSPCSPKKNHFLLKPPQYIEPGLHLPIRLNWGFFLLFRFFYVFVILGLPRLVWKWLWFGFIGNFAATHDSWCVKRVHDAHSASLGSGFCRGFGWVGMEAQMDQCLSKDTIPTSPTTTTQSTCFAFAPIPSLNYLRFLFPNCIP